jgi:hypothetical protein
MDVMIESYGGGDTCPHCGMSLQMAGVEREEAPETAVNQKSLNDILVLPIGVVTGLLILTFPLSLPAFYGIALLLMK